MLTTPVIHHLLPVKSPSSSLSCPCSPIKVPAWRHRGRQEVTALREPLVLRCERGSAQLPKDSKARNIIRRSRNLPVQACSHGQRHADLASVA